jgi:hypothetical protein
MRVVGGFGDADTPGTVLGVHANGTSPGSRRKVGIESLHRSAMNKGGLVRIGLGWIGVVVRLGFGFKG